MIRAPSAPSFAVLVQEFFAQRLLQQQNASAHTVASYRDTMCLLLRYFQECRGKQAADLVVADLDAPAVLAFLDDLERRRHNSIRTRNSRLAALRSFLKYAAARDPNALPVVQRVLAIPMKRFDRPLLGYLSRVEIEAILEAPNARTWSGRRDRVLLSLLYNSGARVSEAITWCRADVTLEPSRSIQIRGKGRKQRVVPLWKGTASRLKEWLSEIGAAAEAPLFPNRHGGPMSRSGVEDRLEQAIRVAAQRCASLRGRRISPHTLRHTTAMHLLQSGVEVTVIALWLGHESPETTHQYVEADLTMKERILGKVEEVSAKRSRYQPKPALLKFLEEL
jgi:site-specific recombinase XerD